MEGVAEVNVEVADSHSAETHLALDVLNVERRDICPANVPTRADVEAQAVPPQNVLSAERRGTFLVNAPREVATSASTARKKDTSHETVQPSVR